MIDRPGVMPNERPTTPTWVHNEITLPRCCPVSTNPQPGSTITTRYRARHWVLEVGSLQRYVRTYMGGHPDGTRNMETMIQKIAADCAAALQVPVTVKADLLLLPQQRMRLLCRARP